MIGKLVAFCVVVAVAHGYSTGAPKEVCGHMVPGHPGKPQEKKAPYSITLDQTKIKADGVVHVKISGDRGTPFKGYFIQGRVGTSPIGAFEQLPGVNLVDCGTTRFTGATHSNSDDKKEIVLKWRAPKGLSESVYFNTTIAQDGGTYWVGLLSSRLLVSAN